MENTKELNCVLITHHSLLKSNDILSAFCLLVNNSMKTTFLRSTVNGDFLADDEAEKKIVGARPRLGKWKPSDSLIFGSKSITRPYGSDFAFW